MALPHPALMRTRHHLVGSSSKNSSGCSTRRCRSSKVMSKSLQADTAMWIRPVVSRQFLCAQAGPILSSTVAAEVSGISASSVKIAPSRTVSVLLPSRSI